MSAYPQWAGIRIDLQDLTGFPASQETTTQRADILNSTLIEFATPNGWQGSFTIARANCAVGGLIATITWAGLHPVCRASFWRTVA